MLVSPTTILLQGNVFVDFLISSKKTGLGKNMSTLPEASWHHNIH